MYSENSKILIICKELKIPTLYEMPAEDCRLFIVPRQLVSTSESVIRNKLQDVIDVGCCVVSTELEIDDKYCIIDNYEWVDKYEY